MLDPIAATLDYCKRTTSRDHAVKVISLIPVINNIFFQIKSEQFLCKTTQEMEDIGWWLHKGFYIQIFFLASRIAPKMEHYDWKGRYEVFTNAAAYISLSYGHIQTLRGKHSS